MNTPGKHHQAASSLLLALEGAAAANLPRRQVLIDWLRDFRGRAAHPGVRIDAADLADLTAIQDYLSVNQVAATPRSTPA